MPTPRFTNLRQAIDDLVEGVLGDDLRYQSYAFNRVTSPTVAPGEWAAIFPDVPAMEQRYRKEHFQSCRDWTCVLCVQIMREELNTCEQREAERHDQTRLDAMEGN